MKGTDGRFEAGEFFGLGDNLEGIDGGPCFSPSHAVGVHDRQIAEAEIGHAARRRADVFGIARLIQDEADDRGGTLLQGWTFVLTSANLGVVNSVNVNVNP